MRHPSSIANLTTDFMEDLAIEVGIAHLVDVVDTTPNAFGGYDFAFGPRQLRLEQEDPEGGVEVYVNTANGINMIRATFSNLTPVAAIAAFVEEAMRS